MLDLQEFRVYLSFQKVSEIVVKRIGENSVDDVFDQVNQSILLDLFDFMEIHL